jgi:hypothetical protein
LFEHDLFGKPLHTFPDHALNGHAAGPFSHRLTMSESGQFADTP